MRQSSHRRLLDRRRLWLTLLPTEACNFRCTYCCQSFAHRRMKSAVVSGVKALLTRQVDRLEEVSLAWFGGEPLLATDVIEDIMQHVRQLRAKHPQLRIASNITTNAFTLSSALAERLIDVGVTDYQITLDGPRRWHDQKRHLANGSGTFDRIWSNLVAMAEMHHRFRVILSLHVDRDNYSDMPEFTARLARTFGHDSRFRLWVRPVSRLGGPNDALLPVLEGTQRVSATESVRRLAKTHQMGLLSTEEISPTCYAAKSDSLVIRADGRVNKCTVALEEPLNQVGRLRENGTIEIERSRMRLWTRGTRSGDPAELRCPLNGIADAAKVEIQGQAPHERRIGGQHG